MDFLLPFLFGGCAIAALFYVHRQKLSFLAQRPRDYSPTGPLLDLRQHLNGAMLCEGVIYGPFGRVSSRFVADLDVTWEGHIGTMKERFRYDDGSTQDRCWTLKLGNDGAINATAPDVIGTGTGKASGSALQLLYRIKVAENSGGHVLDAVDWMYLVENGTIMNRSQFRKFGIKVAELVATMRKVEPRFQDTT